MLRTGDPDCKGIARMISNEFGISERTVYRWIGGKDPLGERAGTVLVRQGLFYAIGALLGDGCIYFWRNLYQVWVYGEREFVSKFASKISECLNRKVPFHPNRRRNVWFVHIDNAELFLLIKSIREDLNILERMLEEGVARPNALEFVEGFFDAEGCVKVVKDSARKTPKICLDFTNTNIRLQELTQRFLRRYLGIEPKLLTQYDKRNNRKPVHHLRIYKKSDIETFLASISTTKMKSYKTKFVEKWLEKKEKGGVDQRRTLSNLTATSSQLTTAHQESTYFARSFR